MQVVFTFKDGWYVARVGDTEVRVLCDDSSWHLHWITEDEDSYTSDSWSNKPSTLEEARKWILKQYENIPHNRLTPDEFDPVNENLRDIMYGTWSLAA